jgi:DNA-binding protein H-NS
MSTISEMEAQIAELQNQINEKRKADIADAVQKVREIVAEFHLTAVDIFPSGKFKAAKKESTKVAAKFRDPVSGKTWSGRGLEPKWLAGKNRADFAI